jgi:hypothetical protein
VTVKNFDVLVELEMHRTSSLAVSACFAVVVVFLAPPCWKRLNTIRKGRRDSSYVRSTIAMCAVWVLITTGGIALMAHEGSVNGDRWRKQEAQAIHAQTGLTLTPDGVAHLPGVQPTKGFVTPAVDKDDGVWICAIDTLIRVSDGKWWSNPPSGKFDPYKDGGVRLLMNCSR